MKLSVQRFVKCMEIWAFILPNSLGQSSLELILSKINLHRKFHMHNIGIKCKALFLF